ncbi:D-alanine--D-alanine ligase [Chromobacterium sp. ATCC 53434]|uniref:D-alanine--D-alanine ligase n=1 Tax=Chromobacterium sp. (strain ATCC 53434 / SC 14030) TaxID=2059672 RepID=UPI000C767F34|nr:D-alanine--D-alanine ligase [Chromobacterium sp. ATCC 53434]AUH51360.1 D-alanine--D-alanine ligase [Chromobacterium sp. ATCC 53434]
MSKIRVGLIFGGQSSEHEVSLQSAKNILQALDQDRFEAALIGIDKQGAWHVNQPSNFLLNADDPARIALRPSDTGLALVPGQGERQLVAAVDAHPLAQIDVVFPIVHGTLGEDGSLQGLLKMANLPFVGAGVLGSAVCMDKDVAKRLLRDAGLKVAPFVTLTRAKAAQADFAAIVAQLGLPLFVKPANQGSSVGVSKVRDEDAFHAAVEQALRFDHKVLVEQAVVGREIECAVLGNAHPQASGCGEVVLSDEFYAYDTKYLNEDGARVAVPADIPDEACQRIRGIAIEAFQALECSGMARVDVFLTPDGEVVINELNTLPGFTNISMYPKLWQAAGLSYRDLITALIELALERGSQDAALCRSAGLPG